jgi:hypothetical protein
LVCSNLRNGFLPSLVLKYFFDEHIRLTAKNNKHFVAYFTFYHQLLTFEVQTVLQFFAYLYNQFPFKTFEKGQLEQ